METMFFRKWFIENNWVLTHDVRKKMPNKNTGRFLTLRSLVGLSFKKNLVILC